MGTRVRTSVATVSLSGSLEDKLRAIADAGFDGFEVFEPDFVSSPLTPRELASRASDLGLTLDIYQPFRDIDSTDERQFARNLVRAERKFDIMEQLGCDLLLVCSSPLPGAVRDDDRLAEQLHELAVRADRRGIRLAYEALAWGAHVNTYRHAWQIVEAADHPALGTCLDSFHILSRGDDPSGIREIPGEKIFFLQLADAPRLSIDVLSWSRHHRNFPGQGNFDLAAFGAHVQASGYTGPWSLEVFNDVFRHSATGRTAADAHRSLLHLQEEVARVQAAESDSRGLALFSPPPRPPIDGVVSLRLAAGPGDRSDLRGTLRHIGFHLVARHHDHDLQLWRHGPLTIAVDATAGTVWTAPGIPADLPVLTQIGIRSDDPQSWGRRAAALEVPVQEVELPGVERADRPDVVRLSVTDATSLDLRSHRSAAAWLSAFDVYPTPMAQWEQQRTLFTDVDHIALAVPEDTWDGVILALRSVFAMEPHEGLDVTDAIGLIHTRSLTLTDGEGRTTLRILLNMVPGSPSGNVPVARRGGVSHVAFSCADIFVAAAQLVANGYEPLPISTNYYDDLEARFGLRPELLRNMRELGILYDANADGEFFHLFTKTVGADLFFEVVQRVGDYQGYGDTNAAVRLSAQLRA
ncbi:sugar phosphate isomerase/epimerase and 4-hydroxyphenylpyruvate domain-containing protein [Antrihabitans sp. YC2-6]|uniref:sugar phosphate isomerase/epimerase and 4-hydroxyphenylpyruvate domain-containing protein n=1 Tax=Antrihabitans sp. YC2-6 TaxID=2799498 RepID=UPI0018F42357|nr:sugar phosphate isomerase/epimerase and 4-hydroxyphenylpyruvate domain-containing protein [Antrihabitans sp. YC2-6]MBJ8348354.1 sugar phosphate isomerase/epimerase and 4-hydroxyphenylpyruvate domain-containing protein [Antrihabitans sp. YC2-6]